LIRDEVCRQYQVTHIATMDEVQDTLFAITAITAARCFGAGYY